MKIGDKVRLRETHLRHSLRGVVSEKFKSITGLVVCVNWTSDQGEIRTYEMARDLEIVPVSNGLDQMLELLP